MNHLGEPDKNIPRWSRAIMTEYTQDRAHTARRGSQRGARGRRERAVQSRGPATQGMSWGNLNRQLCLLGGKGVSRGVEGYPGVQGLVPSVHSHAWKRQGVSRKHHRAEQAALWVTAVAVWTGQTVAAPSAPLPFYT